MFKKLIIFVFVNLFFFTYSYGNINIKARTAILQDFLSGEILYEKEPDRSIYPASMTKIMTSIKEKIDGASLAELMAASNIFGRGFG